MAESKRIVLLFEDDWELRGNGLGNVADIQYLPSLFLMNLAEKFDLRFTFMVDVAQQLIFLKYADLSRKFKIQANLWEETVLLMAEQGHDVQLHLHPQWLGATPIGTDSFSLNPRWNIASLDREERIPLIHDSIEYLKSIIRPVDPSYEIIAFKAGGWAIQPSHDTLEDMINHGIKYIIGPRYGMKYSSDTFDLDYTSMDEPFSPYYPDLQDINKVSAKQNSIMVLPIAPYFVPASTRLKIALKKVFKGISGKWKPKKTEDPYFYLPKELVDSAQSSPILVTQGLLSKLLKGYYVQLDPAQDLSVTRSMMSHFIRQAMEIDASLVPIVLESHTKDYSGKTKNVYGFFDHILSQYGDIVEFKTLREFHKDLQYLNKSMVHKNDETQC